MLATSLLALCAFSAPTETPQSTHLSDAFSPGWMLKDTNEDGIADFIEGKIVVPTRPTAAENAAAANIAARLAFGATGLTLPLVVSKEAGSGVEPRIWIGKDAVSAELLTDLNAYVGRLEANEGGVFALGGGLALVGHDDAGLTAAADAFSARSPYIWKVPGDQLVAIANELSRLSSNAAVRLAGVTYLKGKAGINRAFVAADSGVTLAALRAALSSPGLNAVHELIVQQGGSSIQATSTKAVAAITTPSPGAADAGAPSTEAGLANNESSGAGASAGSIGNPAETDAPPPQPLDLATLYTSKGLFKGSAKMPIPSSLDGQLYVPAGAPGIALANLAARMGLETTGLALPLARAETDVRPKDVHTKAVLFEGSPLGQEAAKKLSSEDTSGKEAETPLASSEGELRVVDRAFGKQSAVLMRGDQQGSVAAMQLLTDRFPNLWETGKQYASLEELRYELHQFFSLRSGVGQSAVALYHLDRWLTEMGGSMGAHDVKAEMNIDLADDHLQDFVKKQIENRIHVQQIEVKVGSLHAGTQCCASNPELHYEQPGRKFEQGTPTFTEDVIIPWEGTRLLNMVRDSLHDLKRGQAVTLVARVSEGPQVRQQLRSELIAMLKGRGISPDRADVEVLCAYKQGYSWLMDEVAPKLQGKPVARLKIEFAKNIDPSGVRAMYSPARWVQELYPVDEMLAKKLNIPLKNVELSELEPNPDSPTYRAHAFDMSGADLGTFQFSVASAMRPYNSVMARYEQVQVETGWVKMAAGSNVVLDGRIKTDLEEFWDHYQDETLPKVYRFVMAQAKGDFRPEFAPPFDTLRLDIHMSEPDYAIGLDKERISTLEALQEDTFYSTENFVNMMGNLEAGRPENYVGRIIPVVHASEDGKDGHVHIEFYGKPAANPRVSLSWTDAGGQHHKKERDLPVLAGAMQPRLIRARVKAGESAIEDLTWLLAADYANDNFEDWVKLEPEEQVERSVFSIAQAKGQIQWLENMHRAGLYADEISYSHLQRLGFEFELPVPLTAKAESPAPRAFVACHVQQPATPRPLIAKSSEPVKRIPIVQWDEPISPDENAAILSKLATYPGVNVYWMGRSYLGRDMWAADIMTPSPARLRSWAKETTLKASILYSGRQHANEVSSTSHVDKLGEQLVSDPQTRAMLKQVNVILHPIDNPDGAQLSMALAKITPDNLLHPGYHGSLAADVVTGQAETDPVYPESRVRRLLLESWLPDGFLNPHGYPSHEWVQPFSEYTGWVQSREGANPGRAWWIPRGWFTSLNYIRDSDHPYSEKVTYELRDRIVEAERGVPGLLDLETRMNDRYQRFGQRWQPKDMTQPIVNGIRIYMSLKGLPAPRPGTDAQRSGSATGGVSPDVTWDAGYTEAPDETAHGDYLKLMASAGLAFDRVHLSYMAGGKLRIRRTQREVGDKVIWQVQRDRPNLPASEVPLEKKAAVE